MDSISRAIRFRGLAGCKYCLELPSPEYIWLYERLSSRRSVIDKKSIDKHGSCEFHRYALEKDLYWEFEVFRAVKPEKILAIRGWREQEREKVRITAEQSVWNERDCASSPPPTAKGNQNTTNFTCDVSHQTSVVAYD